MRKIVLLPLIVIMLLVLQPRDIFAGSWDIYDFHPVDSVGSGTYAASYEFTETPIIRIIYLNFYGEVKWTSPSGIEYSGFSILQSIGGHTVWGTFASWDNVKESGTWDVATYIIIPTPLASASFTIEEQTVVPEPISSTLFIVGGTLLAGRRYMKRKKIA